MSIVAIIPVAQLLAANNTLGAAGWGYGNLSVPAYTGPAATHAATHCWDNVEFRAALEAIAGMVVQVGEGDPVARTKALIEAQGARWGAQAPDLPNSGTVAAGSLYRHDGSLWSVIQSFSRTTYGAPPATYPALIRRVREPFSVEEWKQPLDQYDSYNLVNPFTGGPDRCLFGGKTYATKLNANVWSPGGYPAGWVEV